MNVTIVVHISWLLGRSDLAAQWFSFYTKEDVPATMATSDHISLDRLILTE